MVNRSGAEGGSPDHRELAARLNDTIRHLHRQLRAIDSSLDLPPAQLYVLAILSTKQAYPVGKLAEFAMVAPPTMTRVVSSLEERGLVVRKRAPSDRRLVHVEATPEGVALIARAEENRIDQRIYTAP